MEDEGKEERCKRVTLVGPRLTRDARVSKEQVRVGAVTEVAADLIFLKIYQATACRVRV